MGMQRARKLPVVLGEQLVFTSPWDPVAVRRGDALGLRAFTDELAELVAPGLSNRTLDARWISLIAWCLVCSDAIWRRSGGSTVSTRVDAQSRYRWLQPLELMWIARTMNLVPQWAKGRQLPGRRRVRAWLEGECLAPKFAMSADQYRAYRQTGVYGAYRVVFRRVPGLTVGGDGWTPGPAARGLADWVERHLSSARVGLGRLTEVSGQWGRWLDKEDAWWLRHWDSFRKGTATSSSSTFPTEREFPYRIEEYEQVKALLFGERRGARTIAPSARRRRQVADVLATSAAVTHVELCEEIAASLQIEIPHVALLPHFADLADRGIELMDAAFAAVALSSKAKGLTASELLDRPAIKSGCKELRRAAANWLAVSGSHSGAYRHATAADRFASAVNQRSAEKILHGLLSHHQVAGGGLRWLYLRDGRAVANSAFQNTQSTRYGFRLWPLARLAIQCGLMDDFPEGVLGTEFAEGELLEEVSDNGS